MKIEVGCSHKRQVTKENHELFLKAQEIMEDLSDVGLYHMGMVQVGNLVDYIEETYGLEKLNEDT